MGYFTNAGLFLLNTLFGLYIYAVLLRFLLQMVRADFYNPIAHFLLVVTNPPLKPLRRVIPGLYGIDLASIVLLLILELIFQSLVATLLNQPIAPGLLVIKSVFGLAGNVVTLYLVAILVVVILSWVNPYPNAMSQLLGRLTGPLLRPARQLLPATGGIDFSPMVVGVVLVLIQMALPYLEYAVIGMLR